MSTPVIETKRLILRKFEDDDLKDAFEILKDEEVNRYLPWFKVSNLEETKSFLEKHYFSKYKDEFGFNYAIELKENNKVIGYININLDDEANDVGYGLNKKYWNNGYIHEALIALIEVAKKNHLRYLTATHDIHNFRSGNVLKKANFVYKYSYKEMWEPKNLLVTFRMYQLNLNIDDDYIYGKYWNKYDDHFIEKDVKKVEKQPICYI